VKRSGTGLGEVGEGKSSGKKRPDPARTEGTAPASDVLRAPSRVVPINKSHRSGQFVRRSEAARLQVAETKRPTMNC